MKKELLVMAAFYVPFCTCAAETDLPSCGENCTYTIENNVLTVKPIDKTQPAQVQQYTRDDTPWHGQGITKINIEAGITDIGGHAFEDMATVTSLSLPEGLKTIAIEAFNGIKITRLDLPSTLTSIAGWAFASAPLTEINDIPPGINTIAPYTFYGSK